MTPTGTFPGGVFLMSVSLLNDNQQRRLGTHLGLLASDLEALAEARDLARTEPGYARVREAIAAVRRAMDGLRDALVPPAERPPSLRRRLAAVAEVWAARVEDLRARRLKGYGAVHPELARVLDPRVEQLRRLLEVLADAAAALPEDD